MIDSFRQGLMLFIFLLVSTIGLGQAGPFIDHFNASKSGQQVLLSWIMNIGSTCNGIIIFRSTDSINFQQIGVIPGICGSTVETVRYTHTDVSPALNSRNYYRLEFGGVGISSIIAIDVIDLGSKGYQVWPNPLQSEAKIFFLNDEGFVYELKIFSLQGIQVLETTSDQDYFTIYPTFLPGGYYSFTISRPDSPPSIVGKLLIQP